MTAIDVLLMDYLVSEVSVRRHRCTPELQVRGDGGNGKNQKRTFAARYVELHSVSTAMRRMSRRFYGIRELQKVILLVVIFALLVYSSQNSQYLTNSVAEA
jgi:hypothetical protein